MGIVIDAPPCNTQAYQRAKEVQANLSPQFPTFLKSMLPSHVAGGFWLVNSHFFHASAFTIISHSFYYYSPCCLMPGSSQKIL